MEQEIKKTDKLKKEERNKEENKEEERDEVKERRKTNDNRSKCYRHLILFSHSKRIPQYYTEVHHGGYFICPICT
jgi:hypothetical protein